MTGSTRLALVCLAALIHGMAALPSIKQDWTTHKRMLLQLQSELASNHSTGIPPHAPKSEGSDAGNTSTTPIQSARPSKDHNNDDNTDKSTNKPPYRDYHAPKHPTPHTPSLDDTMMHPPPTPLPTTLENSAESLLKLLLESVDRSDVKTIAQRLLPEYAKQCPTAFDCEEFGAIVRHMYLRKFSELEQTMQRMDTVGLLLRRIQHMAGLRSNLSESSSEQHLHQQHRHQRRRPGWQHHDHHHHLRNNRDEQNKNR